jgi:hypothetical protein
VRRLLLIAFEGSISRRQRDLTPQPPSHLSPALSYKERENKEFFFIAGRGSKRYKFPFEAKLRCAPFKSLKKRVEN